MPRSSSNNYTLKSKMKHSKKHGKKHSKKHGKKHSKKHGKKHSKKHSKKIRDNVKRDFHISRKVLKRFSRLLDNIVPNHDYKRIIERGDMDFLKLLKHEMRKDKVLGDMKDSGVRKIYKGLQKSITYCDSFSDAWKAPSDCQCRDGDRKVRKHQGTRSEGWGCEPEGHHYHSVSPSVYKHTPKPQSFFGAQQSYHRQPQPQHFRQQPRLRLTPQRPTHFTRF